MKKTTTVSNASGNWTKVACLAGLMASLTGCAGGGGSVRSAEPVGQKVPPPLMAPKIHQVAVAANIFGAANADDQSHIGQALAVGDFNGDGYADVAVGIPGQERNRGAVGIIYGSEEGWDLDRANLSNRTRLTGGAVIGFNSIRDGDRFGYALAAGDYDGDGLCDLAIGVPYRAVDGHDGSGEVWIVYGSNGMGAADLLVRHPVRITQTGAGSNEAGDHFGIALAAGDFNGDGIQDLAIGAPDENDSANGRNDSGAVFIRYGARGGIGAEGYHYITPNTTEAGARFGFSLATGMLHGNSDSAVDLAIGAPGSTVEVDSVTDGRHSRAGAGRIYIFNGVPNRHVLSNSQNVQIVARLSLVGVTGFGYSLAAGDFDGDGNIDLASGSPEAGSINGQTEGRIYIMMHNPDIGAVGRRAYPNEVRNMNYLRRADLELSVAPLLEPANGDRFGQALAAADFDADGRTDLAAGAPGHNWLGANDSGVVLVYMGTADGISTKVGVHYFFDQTPRGAVERGDQFGYALAAGNVNGDLSDTRRPFMDLVIGAPFEDNGGADAGAVFLARTQRAAVGAFEGIWSGRADPEDENSEVRLELIDRDGLVRGTGSIGTLQLRACGQTVTSEPSEATIDGTSASHHANGSLSGMRVPSDVRWDGVPGLSGDVNVAGTSLTGRISVNDAQVRRLGVWVPPGGCDVRLDIPALAKQ